MATAKQKPADDLSVEDKLMTGHYDRLLEQFQIQLDEAAAELRRCHAAMKAENTLRS